MRLLVCIAPLLVAAGAAAAEPDGKSFPAEDLEFFEKQVRPLLAARCYKCHGPKMQKGGLRLDSRRGALDGGESGAAVVPGKPAEGYLVDAINYGDVYQMPPDGKLPQKEIDALTRWVRLGAPWPAGETPGAAAGNDEFDLAERARHWSFQSIGPAPPPQVNDESWLASDVDRFILSGLQAAGLKPAAPADRRTLIRRVYFDLVGLPPTPAEVKAFVADDSPQAYPRLVDRLVRSPHFGERWARHWLDLVRYAESRGHEFDYDAPGAHYYRDYVIRAFNADVPYNQFVIEHLAGDLLDEPRRHPGEGFNESLLGTGFWFLGEWVHSPVDIRQDEADRFDNMIDVMGKTFLGLTVACARCHDHKFDAIAQRDYYALAGYLQSSAYRQVRFDTLDHNRQVASKLAALEAQHRGAIVRAQVDSLSPGLSRLADYLLAAREVLRTGPQTEAAAGQQVFADFESGDYAGWTATGTAFGPGPQTLETIAPYQGKINGVGEFFVNSHNVRGKEDVRRGDGHTGTLTSDRFRIERDYITFLIGGGSHAGKTCVNLLIDGKAVLTATGRNNNQMSPHRWDVRKFRGREAQLQIVDDHTGGWGNVGLDHVVFTDTTDGGTRRLGPLSAAARRVVAEKAEKEELDAKLLERWVGHLLEARGDAADPLHAWALVAGTRQADDPAMRRKLLTPLLDAWKQSAAKAAAALNDAEVIVDYALPGGEFRQDGVSFGKGPLAAGQVVLGEEANQPIRQVIRHGGVRRNPAFNGLTLAPGTQKDPGRLAGWVRAGRTFRTPTFTVNAPRVYYLVQGAGRAYAVVDSHRTNNGPLHGALIGSWKKTDDDRPRWVSQNLAAYQGHRAHMEFTAEDDEPLVVYLVVQSSKTPGNPLLESGRLLGAWHEDGKATPLKNWAAAFERLMRTTADQLAEDRIAGADDATDRAQLADWLVQHRELFASGDAAQKVAAAAAPYVAARSDLVASIRRQSRTAPAMWDGDAENELLLIRGNPKTPGDEVPRAFLAALAADDASPPPTSGSGRLELAQRMTDPGRNPFITRVIVNRVWHHLFGRGIVGSVDNFGVLGQQPTHPQLLDHLATRFAEDGWSIKRLIRKLVLTSTYRMSSRPAADESRDPENLLLHRMRIRRLQGEAIRDAILRISGRLDDKLEGPSVPVHLTAFMQGRGRPGRSGPLDGAGRRSIYISIRRNFLSPMMLAFDTPIPFTTMGRRNTSNVPAQALILMNDPFVIEQAKVWAQRTLSAPAASPADRIERMYLAAFARPPSETETARGLAFIHSQGRALGLTAQQADTDVRVWADLCHVLINVKEFVFVR